MKTKKVLKHIKGFSIPIIGGGLSWDISKTEREVIRKLILFLEDRRVLYNPFALEDPRHAIMSIIEIRKYLTDTLKDLDEKSYLNHYLKAMRASCRKFLDKHPDDKFRGMIEEHEIFAGLGEVRAMFGFYLNDLVKRFKFDVENDLKSIFPIEE